MNNTFYNVAIDCIQKSTETDLRWIFFSWLLLIGRSENQAALIKII